MLLDGRYESPGPAEILCSLFAPECPGDLLLQFHHAKISLSLVIGERYGEILHESQDLSLVFPASIQEILRF